MSSLKRISHNGIEGIYGGTGSVPANPRAGMINEGVSFIVEPMSWWSEIIEVGENHNQLRL